MMKRPPPKPTARPPGSEASRSLRLTDTLKSCADLGLPNADFLYQPAHGELNRLSFGPLGSSNQVVVLRLLGLPALVKY